MKFDSLPPAFRERMKELLGKEYESYQACFEEERLYGLRINTWKADGGKKINLPFSLSPVPWTENGFYYREEDRPAKHPYYYAGLYYLQEPSAMAPAAILPVKPGDKVLDLCAAPGGKSTELGARLKGEGLLFSNDISNSRAKALLKNLEMFGLPNICVTSESPDKLAHSLPEFFDAVLIDAPCSGEGMFRKDEAMVKDWEEKGPQFYVPIQREILKAAVIMVKPGGFLLYSTCTFSREEDEGQIRFLLEEYPQLQLVPIPKWEGACPGKEIDEALRLFPHKIKGEGHFLALMRKRAQDSRKEESGRKGQACQENRVLMEKKEKDFYPSEKEDELPKEAREFLSAIPSSFFQGGKIRIVKDCLYLLPKDFPENRKLRYLRTGLFLGTVKKNRFEPSQALAMALKMEDFPNSLSLSAEDGRTVRYLKGETIFLGEEEGQVRDGWILVCADGFPLGWGKASKGAVKNKFYPGWRWQ